MAAEALGSLLLAATVIGSGIMAENLAGGNLAVTLLANTGATVAALAVLIAGCCLGAVLAHAMFGLPLLQFATHTRSGPPQWLAEFVATAGLLLVILGRRDSDTHWLVAAWMGAAYWFTSSTSFANPAITLARSLTNTFAGIRPWDAPALFCIPREAR